MTENDIDTAAASGTSSGGTEQTRLDRRIAMQKLAFHGAVTAPLMLSILTSEKAIAASTIPGGGGGCEPECVPEL